MCGRFFLDAKNREIDRLLEALPAGEPPVRRGEVFPADMALTLAHEGGSVRPRAMRWGFPAGNAKGVIINARSETALSRPMFSMALRRHPAVIPATGFYEWQALAGSKRKLLFGHADGSPLYLAGFWDSFADGHGCNSRRFTILTTAANDSVRFCHDRMPVLLGKDECEPWLEGRNLLDVLRRVPFLLHFRDSSESPRQLSLL